MSTTAKAQSRFAKPLPADLAPVNAEEEQLILSLDATGLLKAMDQKKLTSAKITSLYIRRARQEGQRLNFTTEECFDEAIAAARASDARRAKGEQIGAMEGIPISLKDAFDQKGFDTMAGIMARVDRPFEEDGLFVSVLKRAGAIPIVRTNVPPLFLNWETDNNIFGPTVNPWNSNRGVGGSSGGEGAAVAAQAAVLGFGTDIGGSIRIPSALNGLYGLKPTTARLTTSGLSFQEAPGQITVLSSAGPMGRSVDDLALAMRVLLDPEHGAGARAVGGDVYMPPTPFDDDAYAGAGDGSGSGSSGAASASTKQRLRIGYFLDNGMFAPVPSYKRAVLQACDRLMKFGHEIVEFPPPDVLYASKLLGRTFAIDNNEWVREALKGKEQPHRLLPISATSTTEPKPKLMPPSTALLGVTDEIKQYQKRFISLWREGGPKAPSVGSLDVLLCPVMGVAAPVFGGTHKLNAASSYTSLFNVLGFPAGTVPETTVEVGEARYDEPLPGQPDPQVERVRSQVAGTEGLPIGVQVVGLPFQDELVLRVMKVLSPGSAPATGFPPTAPVAKARL